MKTILEVQSLECEGHRIPDTLAQYIFTHALHFFLKKRGGYLANFCITVCHQRKPGQSHAGQDPEGRS